MQSRTLVLKELKDWLEFFIRNIPGKLGFFIRGLYYKLRLMNNFENVRFEQGIRIESPNNVKIGSNSYIGLDCKIYASKSSKIIIGSNVTFNSNVMINARGKGKIIIGDNVLIGPNSVLRSNNHVFKNRKIPIINQGMTEGEINVSDDVWICSNSVILPNSKIGKGSIIAAGAVVNSNVEKYSVYGGIPAKFLKNRD